MLDYSGSEPIRRDMDFISMFPLNIHLLIVYGNTTIATDQHEFVESDMAGIHARSTLIKLMRSVK